VASFNVDYDAASWVLVPFEFPTPLGESEPEWVARLAQEQRDRGYEETRRTGTLDDYFRHLISIAQIATSDVSHDSIWALIAKGAPGPVIAALDLEPADEPFDEFVTAIAAHRDNQYEPAAVTPVELPNLGQGVRILRHDFDESRQLYVTLYYIFRIDGLDFMSKVQSFDPLAVDWAIPLLEELLGGVHISQG
jgi:hypothetical protein